MDGSLATFNTLPSEILTMFLFNMDDIVDLQNLMLASSHIWRHLAHDRGLLPILDKMLKNGSTHPQVVFSIYAVGHLHHRSPLLDTYIDIYGFNFLQPGKNEPRSALTKRPVLEALPQDMTPAQVRSLLTTSNAIHATTLRCLDFYADRFHGMQPLTVADPISFDIYADTLTDLPAGPRYSVANAGQFTWSEKQHLLKAFWMIHFGRVFFKSFKQGAFEWPGDRVAKVSKMKPIDLFAFEAHGAWIWQARKRPRDYLFDALHLYLSAEEYLADIKAAPQTPLTLDLLPCQRIEGDDEMWPQISETMEHFVRLFKEIRSQRDGDGFYPWRRLGFAIWDEKRLGVAGLINDAAKDRDQDRIRWLSVIRDEDFRLVQNHRLTVHDSDREDIPDYEYPTDTDWSWSP